MCSVGGSQQKPTSKRCVDYSKLSMPSHSDHCRHILCVSQIKVQPLKVVRATEALLKKVKMSGGRKDAQVVWTAGSTVNVAPYTANRTLETGVCHTS